MAKKHSADKGLAARVGKLEKKVSALTEKAPLRPEEMLRQAQAGERADFLRENPKGRDHAGPVAERLAALQGRSRNDVVSDRERGARSPLERKRR